MPYHGIWDLTDENGELPADVDWSTAGPMVTENVTGDQRIETWIDSIYGEGTWLAAIQSYSFGTIRIRQEVDRQIQELFGPGTEALRAPTLTTTLLMPKTMKQQEQHDNRILFKIKHVDYGVQLRVDLLWNDRQQDAVV